MPFYFVCLVRMLDNFNTIHITDALNQQTLSIITKDLLVTNGNVRYSQVSDSPSNTAIENMYDLFGQTGTKVGLRGDGMYLDIDGGNINWLYYFRDQDYPTGNGGILALHNGNTGADDIDYSPVEGNLMGSWICNPCPAPPSYQPPEPPPNPDPTPVPAPTTALLFSLGLLGLARRKLL